MRRKNYDSIRCNEGKVRLDVCTTEDQQDEIGRVCVVQKFENVFEHVMGLLPRRPIKFQIDMMLGA